MSQSKDSEVCGRVPCLVEEVVSWFWVLDASTCEKLHRNLVVYLIRCIQFLVGELSSFNGDLVQKFCLVTMAEYVKSSMKDTIFKAKVQNTGKEFIELLLIVPRNVKLQTQTFAVGTPFHLILRVYATGLHFVDHSMKSKISHLQSFEGAVRVLFDDGDAMNRLSDLLGLWRSFFYFGCIDDPLLSNSQLSSDNGELLIQMQDRKN